MPEPIPSLREQIAQAIYESDRVYDAQRHVVSTTNYNLGSKATLDQSGEREQYECNADAALAVAEPLIRADEREQLRARIEALPHGPMETGVYDGQGHYETADCLVRPDVLAVFDK